MPCRLQPQIVQRVDVTRHTTVGQLPSGRWRARYYDLGAGRWASGGTFATRAEALLAARALVGLTSDPEGASSTSATFAEYANSDFWPIEGPKLAPQTLPSQMSLFTNHVLPKWGDWPLAEIGVSAVEEWVVELRQRRTLDNSRTLSRSAQHQIYVTFTKIMRRALERGVIARSPLPRRSGISQPRPKRPPRPLEPQEVAKLASAAGDWGAAIYAMAYGGFRISELFALRRNDLDLRHLEVSVDESVICVPHEPVRIEGELKRLRAHRSVPLPKAVAEMLWSLPPHPATDLLWVSPSGRIVRDDWFRSRIFHPAARRAGLDGLTPHALRHTAASAWFDEGFELLHVARFLGDSPGVAERTYVHLYKGRRDPRMGLMDARFHRGALGDADSGTVVAINSWRYRRRSSDD